MASVDVGALDDFEVGRIKVVVANGREIGVARSATAVYALRNLCPHQAGPICAGRMLAGISTKSPVGSFDVEAHAPVLACAWHGWEFSLQTGESTVDPTLRVRTYQVRVEGGRVLIEMGGRRVG
jgi:nitrite reductase/ring-hydroxylating ferredoxin subunit